MKKNSCLREHGRVILLITALIGLSLLLAIKLSATVKAQVVTPPIPQVSNQIQVRRLSNVLVAQMPSTQPLQQWRWLRTTKTHCQVSDFETTNQAGLWQKVGRSNRGYGQQVELRDNDAYRTYCFYFISGLIRGVTAYRVYPPKVEVTQAVFGSDDDQRIRARVTNVKQADLEIASWHWYRYKAIRQSSFDCRPQYYGLDDQALRRATSLQVEELLHSNMMVVDSYHQQKDIYQYGTGSEVKLSQADDGLSYCFIASDTAGLKGHQSGVVEWSASAQKVFVPTEEWVEFPPPLPIPVEEPIEPPPPDYDLPPRGEIVVLIPPATFDAPEEDTPRTEVPTVRVVFEEEDTATSPPPPIEEILIDPPIEVPQTPYEPYEPYEPYGSYEEFPDEQGKAGVFDEQAIQPSNENQSTQDGTGQAASGEDQATTELPKPPDEDSNWLVVIGVVIIIVALVIAGAWLITRSRLQDPEAEDGLSGLGE